MQINRGFVIPIVLVVLLLILAGFFVFSKQVAESPIADVTPKTPLKTEPEIPKEPTETSTGTLIVDPRYDGDDEDNSTTSNSIILPKSSSSI